MNEQLQAKLVEILAGIQASTKTAGDFAMEQLPDIAQQYVMYGRAIHTFGMLYAPLVAVTLFFYRRQIGHALGEYAWPVAVLMAGGVSSVIALLINTGPFFLVWFAPKVWLLKELASLIK